MECFAASILVVVTVAALAAITHVWLESKSYVFEAQDIVAITEKAVSRGYGHKETFQEVEQELRARYGGRILPNPEWLFINCGGWMGGMYILHSSLTEYVLFFGTAIGSSGHSGRYWANISDTVIEGEYTRWPEGTTDAIKFETGDTIYHVPGEVAAVHWSPKTWMVEYGRGFVPSTLVFALADTLFSTTDFVNLYKIIKVYTIGIMHEFSNNIFGV
ncbi:sigma non-opioid intracellular receptor 1-like [Corticium candelabrum]|uniref:sigma non-opioid intracellular receptor 1-like n=1 Tax=Corticium candelabrum TaxID=121492 RepID=UPI002E26F3FD|nr:sigma non-opioid intracellular receptor 1-like [Corticium candelabrum]